MEFALHDAVWVPLPSSKLAKLATTLPGSEWVVPRGGNYTSEPDKSSESPEAWRHSMVRSTCGVDLLLPRRLKITSDFPAAIFIPEADAHAANARPELAIWGNNVLIERLYAQSSGLLLKNAPGSRNAIG